MVYRQVEFDPQYLAWLAMAQAEVLRAQTLLDGEPADLEYVPGELPS